MIRLPSRSKYRAMPQVIDGIRFASKKESRRYRELKFLVECRAISKLELQPRFEIEVNGQHICRYTGDFRYIENGVTIIEDVKGFRTPTYRLKAKLMKAIHGIEIKET